MQEHELVGIVLVVGLVVFLIGAGGWKLVYEQPLRQALPVIHLDRCRRAWVHLWMIPAVFLTSAGVLALAGVVTDGIAVVLSLMAGVVYTLGAVCWIASLAFRLTVVPWAAEQTLARGDLPEGFAPLDSWAGSLYAVHMVSAYVAFAILGVVVLADGELPRRAGWIGVVGGLSFAAGFLATRQQGPFNPPVLQPSGLGPPLHGATRGATARLVTRWSGRRQPRFRYLHTLFRVPAPAAADS